ncbi:MAG: cupin domain-containing protein [Dehalococcoidia bacterium]
MVLTETVTKKGEEPHTHVHDVEDELFYVLDGKLTFHCNDASYDVEERAFVFVPRGTPHTYTIRSDGEIRFLVMSLPGTFGEHIERTGERIDAAGPRLPNA